MSGEERVAYGLNYTENKKQSEISTKIIEEVHCIVCVIIILPDNSYYGLL